MSAEGTVISRSILTIVATVGGLLAQMLWHHWAPGNSSRRINVDEALGQPIWEPWSDNDPQTERMKPGYS